MVRLNDAIDVWRLLDTNDIVRRKVTIMIRVQVDSIRFSLLTQQRVVVLREINSRRYVPIWIGPFEADAIALAV